MNTLYFWVKGISDCAAPEFPLILAQPAFRSPTELSGFELWTSMSFPICATRAAS